MKIGLISDSLRLPFAESISLTAHALPISWHKRRMAASVTPAIGASPAPFALRRSLI